MTSSQAQVPAPQGWQESTKKGSLGQAKVLGGVGAVLTILGLVPVVGTALVIVGWALVLVALKDVSDAVRDRSILNNAIVAAVLAMIGAVGLLVVGGIIIGLVGLSNWVGGIGSIFAGLSILWVLAVVSSVFLYMSFKAVGTKLNAGLFGTAALIYIIGQCLTILLVGFLISPIAQLLFAVAFFTMPEGAGSAFASQTTPEYPRSYATLGAMAGAAPERRFCPSCGAGVEAARGNFCTYCGGRVDA